MAREAPHLLRPDHVAALQSSAGNKTVQGLFGFGKKSKARGGPSPLTWQNTRWADTKYLASTKEGSSGVLFAGVQGSEVVVKPAETLDIEGSVASLLVTQAAAASGTGFGLAPGYRLASNAEVGQMQQAFQGLTAGKEKRVANLVGKLAAGNVVVQDVAQGKSLSKALEDVPKHTRKRRFGGGRKLRSTSPMRIFTDARAIYALGSVHAADLVMSNTDRLEGMQIENLLVTPTSIRMIDNVINQPGAYLRAHTEKLASGDAKHTVDSSFTAWKGRLPTQLLATDQYDQIAAMVFAKLLDRASQMLGYDAAEEAGGLPQRGRAVDGNAMKQVLGEHKERFEKTFAEGLEAGRQQVIRSLNQLLQDPGKLNELIGGKDVADVRSALTLRRDFLVNGS